MHLKSYSLKPSSDFFFQPTPPKPNPLDGIPPVLVFLCLPSTLTHMPETQRSLDFISRSFLAVKLTPTSTHYTTTPNTICCNAGGNSSRNYNIPAEDVTVSDQGCQKIPSVAVALPESAAANT